jgi:hypothetical protein
MDALRPRVDRVDWVMLDALVGVCTRCERCSLVVDIHGVTVHRFGHVQLVIIAIV